MAEKKNAEGRHSEGLDKPVHNQCDDQPLRFLTDAAHGRKIHADHHGPDHGPDEQGDSEIHICISETGKCFERARHDLPQANPNRNGE